MELKKGQNKSVRLKRKEEAGCQKNQGFVKHDSLFQNITLDKKRMRLRKKEVGRRRIARRGKKHHDLQ